MPDSASLTTISPQRRNVNKHTARGVGQLGKSIQSDGWIGAITVAADGETFDGSARIEVAASTGFEDALIVESDGTRPIVVKRTDIPTADDPRAIRLGIAANRVAQVNLEWDTETLAGLIDAGADVSDFWFEDELAALLSPMPPTDVTSAADAGETPERPTLADRFVVPPFSVLDARQGYWQERKRHWLAYGIQSELGRGDLLTCPSEQVTEAGLNYYRNRKDNGLLGESEQARAHYSNSPGGSPRPATRLGADGKTQRGDGTGRGLARTFGQDLMRGEHVVGAAKPSPASLRGGLTHGTTIHPYDVTGEKRNAAAMNGRPPHGPTVTQNADGSLRYSPTNAGDGTQSGTSIFDPVLCELAYRWFCPAGGLVLDPFAGGSVRGVLACLLGRDYIGVDLSGRQLAANEEQAATITPARRPRWVEGDSAAVVPTLADDADFVFSCPPYADLEVYSDDPRDLSTMGYAAFVETYRAIVASCVARLRPDRFACFVVGDVRDSKGLYRNFVSDTIAAFQDAGAALYNEAILVTAVGSLPIRVGKQFSSGRKLGKTHQNVLVFVKGDPRKAADACGVVDVTLPDVPEEWDA